MLFEFTKTVLFYHIMEQETDMGRKQAKAGNAQNSRKQNIWIRQNQRNASPSYLLKSQIWKLSFSQIVFGNTADV